MEKAESAFFGKDPSEKDYRIDNLHKRIRQSMNDLFCCDEVVSKSDPKERKTAFLEVVRTRVEPNFRDLLPDISSALDMIAKTEYASEKELQDAVSEAVFGAASKIPLAEIEQRAHKHMIEQQGHKEINRVLTYDVTEDRLYLHVPTVFVDSPIELKKLLEEGLRILARKLKTEEELAGIKTIIGASWIVFKSRRAVEKMGFTITGDNEESKIASAEISREKLMEIYG